MAEMVWGTGMESHESDEDIRLYLLREGQFDPGTEEFAAAAVAIRELSPEFFREGPGSTGRLKQG